MAELVDALDSKSGFRKEVQVRFLFWAQKTTLSGGFFDRKSLFLEFIKSILDSRC